MNHKITKITSQKNKERLNIYLDDDFAFGIKQELLLEYDLRVGQELDDSIIERIKASDELKKCLDKAYRYLSYRPRSEKEVRDKLLEKYPSATVTEAMAKLKKLNYVNDQQFVNFWLEARGNTRGPALLKSELLKKGVAKEIVDDNFNSTNKDKLLEDATTLIESKRKYRGLTKAELYKKVGPFLSRRGYSYDTVKEVVRRLSDKDN